MSRHTLSLDGCAQAPLAHYLKALGVFRIVSEQKCNGEATACWRGGTFELTSPLDRQALADFFLRDYSPSPMVAPWNGGSGFFSGDYATALQAIAGAKHPRFREFQANIGVARSCLSELGLTAKPEKTEKDLLLGLCRNRFSGTALDWLDTACLITADRIKFPPLLGTGGNDGRLEFTNNYMQRLAEVFGLPGVAENPKSAALLDSALFGSAVSGLEASPIGQFYPSASGGANGAAGFSAKPVVNPWDFILMLEGALLLSGTVIKRLEPGRGQLAFPFCVRASGVGYGSASHSDEAESRGEIWLPLWDSPVNFAELQALFAEGRASVGDRPARTGIDFARAVASLGVDRGISAFLRYGFQARNGLAYFAIPLERVAVRSNRIVSKLLDPIDGWIEQFRQTARTGDVPSPIDRALRNLETGLTSLCKSATPLRVQALLVALSECEAALSACWKWTRESHLRPIPMLPSRWLREAAVPSAEFRLAAAAASLGGSFGGRAFPLRVFLETVRVFSGAKRWVDWTDWVGARAARRVTDPVAWLNAILAARLESPASTGARSFRHSPRIDAALGDIAAFIERRTNDYRLMDLLSGLALVDIDAEALAGIDVGAPADVRPPDLYGLLKLCFPDHPPGGRRSNAVPGIHRLASAGRGMDAALMASRRLSQAGLSVGHDPFRLGAVTARSAARTAAALLFPLAEEDVNGLSPGPFRPKNFHEPSQHES